MPWAWFAQNKLVIWIGATLMALIALLLGWEKVKADIKKAAKMAEREAGARKAADAALAMNKAIQENSNALVHEGERVRALDAVVELPDGRTGLPPYHYRD